MKQVDLARSKLQVKSPVLLHYLRENVQNLAIFRN